MQNLQVSSRLLHGCRPHAQQNCFQLLPSKLFLPIIVKQLRVNFTHDHEQDNIVSAGGRLKSTHEAELMYAFASMSALFVLAKLTRAQSKPAHPKALICSRA